MEKTVVGVGLVGRWCAAALVLRERHCVPKCAQNKYMLT